MFLFSMVKAKSVDKARLKIFQKKNQRENKITDLALLPPCTSVLKLHATRSNAVAYLWRNSASPRIEFPSIEESGWTHTGEIFWVYDAFPLDVEKLLTSEDDSNNSDEEDDDESADSIEEYELGSDIDSDDELD